jgi:general stress protein YciG
MADRPGEGKNDTPDGTPETPLDEPRPSPVEDPPSSDSKGPYVVRDEDDHAHNPNTEDQAVNTGERKERRGFASMSPEKQREIASKGGRAAHEKGTAHEWTADEARTAGRKGGQVSRGGRGRLIVSDELPPSPEGDGTAQ